MITCLVTNWGISVFLGLMLVMSEWLAKTKKFKENGILDLGIHFLKIVLNNRGDKK